MPNNGMQHLVNLARATAIAAHAGQVDKAGEPYWRHPERVASNFTDAYVLEMLARIAAWLHDTLEDTALTPADLREIGFPARVVAVVEAVTRRAEESYEQFIERVATDPIAIKVKLADLADNLDPARRWQPGASHRQRYLDAQTYLREHDANRL